MVLDIPFTVDSLEEAGDITSRTYAIDWKKGRIAGFIDEQDAVRQYITKALITPRFKCLIYDSQYGSEIRDIVIAKNATKEYVETEIGFLVKDAIIYDDRITDVYNVTSQFGDNNESVIVRFDVDTIYGSMHIEEVV